MTHRQLLTAVWGPAHVEDTQYLRVYVGQLRQKLEEHPDDPKIILTEPGIGYRLAEALRRRLASGKRGPKSCRTHHFFNAYRSCLVSAPLHAAPPSLCSPNRSGQGP